MVFSICKKSEFIHYLTIDIDQRLCARSRGYIIELDLTDSPWETKGQKGQALNNTHRFGGQLNRRTASVNGVSEEASLSQGSGRLYCEKSV